MSAPGDASDRAFIERSLRIAITALSGIGFFLLLLWLLKGALTPLAAAFGIAYLFDPLVRRFQAQGLGRRMAIVALLGASGLVLVGFLLIVVPLMQREIVELTRDVPAYVARGIAWATPRLEALDLPIPTNWTQLVEELRSGRIELPIGALRDAALKVLFSLTGTLGALIGLLIIPVIAYYLLADFEAVKRGLLSAVPRPYEAFVRERSALVDQLLSGFLRGQLTVCAILAVLYAAGFAVIGVPLAVVIGLAAGFLAIVPYMGNAVALGSALLLCLFEYGLDRHAVLVLVWYAIVQNLEGFVLTPRIVGGNIGLHPATVIVALLIGGDLLGFLGLLVAVPLAAVAQVFLKDLLRLYRESSLYARGVGDG